MVRVFPPVDPGPGVVCGPEIEGGGGIVEGGTPPSGDEGRGGMVRRFPPRAGEVGEGDDVPGRGAGVRPPFDWLDGPGEGTVGPP